MYKVLARFPKHDHERILATIGKMLSDPYTGDIEKMEGRENAWRHRIGAYRIFYELCISEKIIHVFRVERRTSKTY